MVAPNIKINSSMIEDFSSPVSNVENRSTYLHVSDSNKIEYYNIDTLIEDIKNNGGTAGGGTVAISEWKANKKYVKDDIVIYSNSIFKCKVTESQTAEFDMTQWQLLAGYFKNSYFYYDENAEITSIVLPEKIADKNNVSVNVNNLLLQSNNYILDADKQTIIFNEPIAPATNIEVIVYGNMTVVANASDIKYAYFNTTADSTDTFEIGDTIFKKEFATVNVNNDILLLNEWDLDKTKSKVILKTPVPAGTKVQVSYFADFELDVSVTFTPDTTRNGNKVILSWDNDGGLDNPDPVEILDGATFTPHISTAGTNKIISWTNNAELANPESVILTNGATFTPQVETNPNETIISWTNDADLDNPTPVSIYTNYAQRIVDTFTATDAQTTFTATHEIIDKSVLSVNVNNKELSSNEYSIESDKKTVKLLNGANNGDIVDIKYFYNLNIGMKGDSITPKGDWSATEEYKNNDFVLFADDTHEYGYIALKDVPIGTELTNTKYWLEMYKITKTYIGATIVDWDE